MMMEGPGTQRRSDSNISATYFAADSDSSRVHQGHLNKCEVKIC